MKLKIQTDGFQGYKQRALARAKRIDRGERLKPEISITFDNPIAMAELLTVQRLRLLQQVKTQAASVSELARILKRDASALRKDVSKLERAGVVRTEQRVNPGHGRARFVLPIAKDYRLTTTL